MKSYSTQLKFHIFFFVKPRFTPFCMRKLLLVCRRANSYPWTSRFGGRWTSMEGVSPGNPKDPSFKWMDVWWNTPIFNNMFHDFGNHHPSVGQPFKTLELVVPGEYVGTNYVPFWINEVKCSSGSPLTRIRIQRARVGISRLFWLGWFWKKNNTFSKNRWWFQRFFIFTPIWGKIPILTNIFQMGRNHQLVKHLRLVAHLELVRRQSTLLLRWLLFRGEMRRLLRRVLV